MSGGWVECSLENCKKWRRYPDEQEGNFNSTEEWNCSMNTWDAIVNPKKTEIWQVEGKAKTRSGKEIVKVKVIFRVGAVYSPAIFSIHSETTEFSKACDPNFKLIGHKLFIFPSGTCFRKISLRSKVSQIPLSYQLRFEIKDLGIRRIYFTFVHILSTLFSSLQLLHD